MRIRSLQPSDLLAQIHRLWEESARKLRALEDGWNPAGGAPVFTVEGRYTARGWTEWTQGFQFGSALLQFDATGDREFLELGRSRTLKRMAPHLTHFGVHDHGFNNVSTYGALLRLVREGRIPHDPMEEALYVTALQCSGAVQARRWTPTADGGGFIHSFNGPHSLFADTIRSLRSLASAHRLGHVLMDEQERRVLLLERLIHHGLATARYTVFYGEGRDSYDVRGRVAHESLFNPVNGVYRCPSTQQGYSPFSTWTRGLAWVMLGFAEELEYLGTLPAEEFTEFGGRELVEAAFRSAAVAACDFYLENTPSDGIPYWDTGAPALVHLGDYLDRPAEPFNDYEPVDSSAAAIAAQGLIRLGTYLSRRSTTATTEDEDEREDEHNSQRQMPYAERLFRAGLTIAKTLFSPPYLSEDVGHQGLILHSVYHRPNGWDYVPPGRRIPCGESSMWGDYHARELALTIQRLADPSLPHYCFFGPEWE